MINIIFEYFFPPASSASIPLLIQDQQQQLNEEEDFVQTNPIFLQDIQNVKLKPPRKHQNSSSSYSSINLQSLSTQQLNDIKQVKLRKTTTNPTQTVFQIRHPCLRELLQRRLTIH